MGVYSNLAAQKVSEDAMIGSFSANSLLEFSINVQREEQAMFDAMIEMDFREAYYEHGVISITEAEKESGEKAASLGIIAKIKAMLDKFIQTISLAVKKFVLKFQDFFKINEKLVKSIGDIDIEALKLAQKSGKYDNLKFTVFYDSKNNFSDLKSLKKLRELEAETKKAIEDEKGKKDANYSDILDKLVNDINDPQMNMDINDDSLFGEETLSDLLRDPKYFGDLKRGVTVKSKDSIQTVTEEVKQAIDDAKKAKRELKDDDRAYLSAMNAMYAKFISAYTKLLNTIINITVKSLSAQRATYAKLGSIVKKYKNAKKPEDVKVDESAVMLEMFTIDMTNEEFMDNIFA